MSTIFNKHPLTLAIGTAIVTGSAMLTGCGGGGDDAVVILPPATGTYTINTAGGNGGDTGTGGPSSGVDVYLYGGTTGVKVLKSGKANTAFTSQKSKITPDLGNVPLVISSSTTIHAANLLVANAGAVTPGAYYMGTDGNAYKDDGNGTANYATEALASGTPYTRSFNAGLYLADGGDAAADTRVTGLQVNAGATLTLDLNYSDWAYVRVYNDLVNKGAITTTDFSTGQRGHLELGGSSYLGSGTINTAGTGSAGQYGGDVYIYTDYSLINSGAITTSGAANAAGDGGYAGYIDIQSYYYTENTGALTANGGAGTGGAGGSGGYAYLYSTYGALNNSGNITTAGGNGTTNGGAGAYAEFNTYAGGKVKNSGNINTSGGNGTSGDGGSAALVSFYGYGPLTANSGHITATGGNAGNNAAGGTGGTVYMSAENGYSSWNYGITPTGNIELSGNINLAGGSAIGGGVGVGGSGGYVDIWTNPYGHSGTGNTYTASTQKIALLGYKSIDTHGGDGLYPGHGGNVSLQADYAWDDTTYSYGFAGPVINEADINTSAGNLTTGATSNSNGTYAGSINIETARQYADKNPDAKAINRGKLTLNGGTARNNDLSFKNMGGGVWMWGYHGTNNSGSITANGGNDVAADGGTLGVGGYSGSIELYSEMGPVTSSAAITANGGNGEYRGGPAQDWTALYGPSVNASGTIKGKGGDANTALAGSMGGYGGWVWLMGTNGPNSVSHGTITMTAGTGNITNDLWMGWDTYKAYYGPDAVPVGYNKVIGAHCDGDC